MNRGRSVVSWIEIVQKLQRIDVTHPVYFTPPKLVNSTPGIDGDTGDIGGSNLSIDLTLLEKHDHHLSSKGGRIKF